ncbi:uncharacterized protein J4E78_009742 [Alternaria triticimaculans]|uniref:uncharacterized protein n=1 Tax=Alternaria triticimaculans TaxID=297637 RepID=UPI0020C5586E|nr:uncharacterized protein J4E78_009742 [Alternaria triticimaculans]KAI4643961.1 hypothetical protein J4E78_009742 [Alternaria triticimaculans]
MTPTKKRLEKEYQSLRKTPAAGYHVELKHGDIFEWTGTLHGLSASPYEGGTFAFHIQFTDEYPEAPPKLNFTTKIYHPNVDARTGVVSWKMIGEEWHHNNTMEKVLIGLRTLLDHPELESAVEVGIANEFANERGVFEKRAREWTGSLLIMDQTRAETITDFFQTLMDLNVKIPKLARGMEVKLLAACMDAGVAPFWDDFTELSLPQLLTLARKMEHEAADMVNARMQGNNWDDEDMREQKMEYLRAVAKVGPNCTPKGLEEFAERARGIVEMEKMERDIEKGMAGLMV